MLAQLLARFDPFRHLEWNQLLTLAGHCRCINIAAGRRLTQSFSSREHDYFLVEGKVRLGGYAAHATFDHTSARASQPLFPDRIRCARSRPSFLITHSTTLLLIVDASPVKFLLQATPGALGTEPLPACERAPMDEWMAQVLGSELLNGLEPAELQRFFRALVRAEVPAGCVVLEPGQASDRVYLVQRGMVEVCPGNQSRILGAGYFFGQDGLIRDQPRNARVTMLASGDVCSLSKAVFLELFHPLLLKPSHSPDLSCQQRVAIRVLSIDVPRQRLPDQERHSLCGPELLIPLCELRDRLGRLERRPLYRVQGGDWRSCELAVFLLREAGFRAELLVPGSSHAGTVRPSAQSRRASIDSARNTETG